MRQEVFEIVQKMDKDNIRTQMALQCAPLITGLKVANLLIIPSKNEKYVGAILDGTDISYIRLAKSECKTTFFLYNLKYFLSHGASLFFASLVITNLHL